MFHYNVNNIATALQQHFYNTSSKPPHGTMHQRNEGAQCYTWQGQL